MVEGNVLTRRTAVSSKMTKENVIVLISVGVVIAMTMLKLPIVLIHGRWYERTVTSPSISVESTLVV